MYGSPDTLPVPTQSGAQYQSPAPGAQSAAWTAPAEQAVPAPAPNPAIVGQPSRGYAQPQGSGMVNQMLAEQGNGCGCGDGSCGQSVCSGPCYDNLWYTSVSALALTRGPGRRLWTSSEKYPNEAIQIGNSDVPMAWSWGGEVQLGRRFCCDCTPCAIEATFWTTTAFNGSETSTSTLGAGTLIETPLQTGWIGFVFPDQVRTASDIFDNALTSTVSRRDEFYDLEINLIREKMAWCCDSSWEIGWSLGIRYFRFQESLSVSATTPLYGGLDAYFKDSVTNNLIGPQIGFELAYKLGCNCRLFISPKFGIYGNWVDNNFDSQAREGTGAYINGVNGVLGYPNFPAHGTGAGVSFLTQIDVGLDWQFTRNWSAKLGYRVVAMTGVGLAEDEYPQYLCDTLEMQNPEHTSSLVLHGAFLGLTYNF
jgi:hypothetical protein